MTKKLVTGQEKEKIWSMLTPWLCRPLNPFEDVLLKDILAERDADKAKFMNMTVFWLRATEVGEVFKAEASDLFQIYSNNIVRIDLDFKAENEPVVVPQNAKSRVNEALTKHKSLPLKLRMKIRALNEPIKW